MKFKDQLRFVRQNMKKNKSRVFMTVLATAMGCAFLIVLASVGFGLQKSIVDKIVGDRLVTAITVWGKKNIDQQLNAEDLKYLKSLNHVKAVTYKDYIMQPLVYTSDNQTMSTDKTVAVDFEEEAKAGFALAAGRLPQKPGEVVAGFHFGKTVIGPEDAARSEDKRADKERAEGWIGKKLTFDVHQLVNGKKESFPQQVTVVGIKEKPKREWLMDTNIYIEIGLRDQIEQLTGTQLGEMRIAANGNEEAYEPRAFDEPRNYNSVETFVSKAQQVKETAETMREKGYSIHSIADEVSQIDVVFTIMKIGLVFVGTIAILIASIGIFNTMTMAVTERSQDIGIMKAIGAHPRIIRRIFLLESAWIGLLGALVGTAAAYLLSAAVNTGVPLLIQAFMNEKVPQDFIFSLIPPIWLRCPAPFR